MTASLPKPLWSLPLHRIPCDYCMEPADGMLVYADKRVVIHVNRKLRPCEGLNPVPTPPRPQPRYPLAREAKWKARVARRMAANPKAKK